MSEVRRSHRKCASHTALGIRRLLLCDGNHLHYRPLLQSHPLHSFAPVLSHQGHTRATRAASLGECDVTTQTADTYNCSMINQRKSLTSTPSTSGPEN